MPEQKYYPHAFIIPTKFVAAIVDADYTGLTEQEEKDIDSFLHGVYTELPDNGYWEEDSGDYAESLSSNSVNDLCYECITVNYYEPV